MGPPTRIGSAEARAEAGGAGVIAAGVISREEDRELLDC